MGTVSWTHAFTAFNGAQMANHGRLTTENTSVTIAASSAMEMAGFFCGRLCDRIHEVGLMPQVVISL
jgi:hypothetical protein